jgi:hypothetical protein
VPFRMLQLTGLALNVVWSALIFMFGYPPLDGQRQGIFIRLSRFAYCSSSGFCCTRGDPVDSVNASCSFAWRSVWGAETQPARRLPHPIIFARHAERWPGVARNGWRPSLSYGCAGVWR